MSGKSGKTKDRVEDLPVKDLSDAMQEQTKGGLQRRTNDDDDDLSDLEIQRHSNR
jgi:hypothetical protein